MVDYTDWFSNMKLALHYQNKANLLDLVESNQIPDLTQTIEDFYKDKSKAL